MDSASQDSEAIKSGLAYWMRRALRECGRAAEQLDAEAVHDLRVALRHCLSIADSAGELDPHPGWKRLKRSAKKLLKHLGNLRDSQVLVEWLARLEFEATDSGKALKLSLEHEQTALRAEALAALSSFNHKRWKTLARELAPRAEAIAPGSETAEYFALRRWEEAYHLHRFALGSRSKISFHRLRIAIKDFRYFLENFLPELQTSWAADLRFLQDSLGERHDLDVLWTKILRLKSVADPAKTEWSARIAAEEKQRLVNYLTKTKGKRSLWLAWRAALPEGERLEEAGVAALGTWSSFRTPDFASARRVAGLAIELYSALATRGFANGLPGARLRYILEAAALLQDVGRFKGDKGHHKRTYRMIRKLPLPIGWDRQDLLLTALIARYHRKALPQLTHKEFRSLSSTNRQATLFLAGILRLVNCLAHSRNGAVRRFSVDVTAEGIVIQAYGFAAEEPLLSKLASAKHLLEIACRCAILVIPGAAGAPAPISSTESSATAEHTSPVRTLRAHA
jgi:CHAD domain-containing protein